MGLLYCLGWLEPSGIFWLSESRAPGLPCGGPGSEASVCEEKTEVWEKEELKVCLSSGVPRLTLASELGLGAARLLFVSRAGSWHRVAVMQGREKRAVRGHPCPSVSAWT